MQVGGAVVPKQVPALTAAHHDLPAAAPAAPAVVCPMLQGINLFSSEQYADSIIAAWPYFISPQCCKWPARLVFDQLPELGHWVDVTQGLVMQVLTLLGMDAPQHPRRVCIRWQCKPLGRTLTASCTLAADCVMTHQR
jgi:hypothetical protein